MSLRGLEPPQAKDDSPAPHTHWAGLGESTDLSPRPALPLLSQHASEVPGACSPEGRPGLRGPRGLRVLRQAARWCGNPTVCFSGPRLGPSCCWGREGETAGPGEGPHSPFSPRRVGGAAGNHQRFPPTEAAQTLGEAHTASGHLCGLGPVTLRL